MFSWRRMMPPTLPAQCCPLRADVRCCNGDSPQFSHQGLRVLRCAQLGVGIVKKTVDIPRGGTARRLPRKNFRGVGRLLTDTPGADPSRPTIEGRIAVTTSIQLLVPM